MQNEKKKSSDDLTCVRAKVTLERAPVVHSLGKKLAGLTFIMCVGAAYLLTFFVLPKTPYAVFQHSRVSFNPYTVTQTYKVYNRNFFPIKLTNFDLVVMTETPNGLCNNGAGVVDDAIVPSYSNVFLEVIHSSNASAAQQLSIYDQCKSPQGLSYQTVGTVDMAAWLFFPGIQFGPMTNVHYCDHAH
ncbi:hypothetical protein EON65_19440 [archaeon]|nr:MAG: hypothetical protein EON65_19440 [archaeon]